MRSAFFYFVPFSLSCLLLSTRGESQLQKIFLHPKTVAREKQSKFVDSIRFIPLEVKDGIRLGTNYNVNVTEKYILLIDYMSKGLFFYSRDGRFVKNINFDHLGGSFYPSYKSSTNQVVFFGQNKNYSLTPKDLAKIRSDWRNPRNRKYFKKYVVDLTDPSLIVRKEIPDEKDILQVHHLFEDYYAQGHITVSPLYKDSIDHELKLYKNNTVVKTFFPYNRIKEPRFLFTEENIGLSRTDTSNIHFISRPYSDTIYKMAGDSLFPAYHVVLPLENTLPASFYTRAFKNKTERDNFNRNNGWAMRQIYSFYETPRFIYFMVGYFSNYESYLYEKQTETTYKTKNVRPDSSQYNLELFSTFGLMRDGSKFYKSQRAGDILSFFEQNKNVPIPKELEEFIKSKPPANTPVIVEFRLKN